MEFLRNTEQIQEESKIFLHKPECACCSKVGPKHSYVRVTRTPNIQGVMSFHSFDFYHLICKECHEQIREAKRVFNPMSFPSWSMLRNMLTVPMMMEIYQYISEPLDEIDDRNYSYEDFSPWDCSPWEWFNQASQREHEQLVRDCLMERYIESNVHICRLIANGKLPMNTMYRVSQFC